MVENACTPQIQDCQKYVLLGSSNAGNNWFWAFREEIQIYVLEVVLTTANRVDGDEVLEEFKSFAVKCTTDEAFCNFDV